MSDLVHYVCVCTPTLTLCGEPVDPEEDGEEIVTDDMWCNVCAELNVNGCPRCGRDD